mgnify:FL=1
MAIPLRRLFPLQQARLRRLELGRYIQFDGSRTYIALAILLALMGVATVAQTARVAQTGHQIDQLLAEQQQIERDNNAMKLQIADAQSMQRIEKYAKDTKMIPNQDVTLQYMVLKSDHGQLVVESTVTP